MKRHALLIGTDTYEAPELSRLAAPVDDIERLARVLRDPGCGAFDIVTVMINRPSYELLVAIEELTIDRHPDDLVLLYVSCHGVKDHRGRLYFAAVNTQMNRLAATGVAAGFINDQLGDATAARSRVLLLDCCFSGSFADGLVAKAADSGVLEDVGGAGYVVMTASDAYSPAYEDATAEARSIFTDVVVEGLTSGAADTDGDGAISTNDLFDYAFPIVAARSPQRPNYLAANLEGRIVLAHAAIPSQRVPTPPAATGVPDTGTAIGREPAAAPRRFDTWEQYLGRVAATVAGQAGDVGPDDTARDGPILAPLGGPVGLATRLVAVDPAALPAVVEVVTSQHSPSDTAAPAGQPEQVLIDRAWRAASHGWWEEAQTQFAAAVRQEPLSITAWWGMGCCHGIANAWPRAVDSFTKAARYASAVSLSAMVGATLLAVAAAKLGGLPNADRLLRDALAMAPDCPELAIASALDNDDAQGIVTAAELDPFLVIVLEAVGDASLEAWNVEDLTLIADRLEERLERADQAWTRIKELAAIAEYEFPQPAETAEQSARSAGSTAAGRVLVSSRMASRTEAAVAAMEAAMPTFAEAVRRFRVRHEKQMTVQSPPPSPPEEPQGWFLTSRDWDAYERAVRAHRRLVEDYRTARESGRKLAGQKLAALEQQVADEVASIRADLPAERRGATVVPW